MSLFGNSGNKFSLGGKNDLVGLDFEVAGVRQLDRGLGLLISKAHDLRGAWDEVQADFIEGEKSLFASEGRSVGRAFARLSPRTLALKSRRYPGKKILERDLIMRKSLTEKSHENHVFVSTKTSMSIGTSARSRSGYPYPMAHAKGTRHMPARNPIQLSNKQKKTWPKIIQAYIWNSGQDYFRRTL